MARAGQDLSKYGVRHSHFGFVYRQDTADGGHARRAPRRSSISAAQRNPPSTGRGLASSFWMTSGRRSSLGRHSARKPQSAMLRVLQDAPAVPGCSTSRATTWWRIRGQKSTSRATSSGRSKHRPSAMPTAGSAAPVYQPRSGAELVGSAPLTSPRPCERDDRPLRRASQRA